MITELRDSTFFAEIRMTLAGQGHVVSARPSDAIALAARLGTTIYAEDALLDAEGVVLQTEDEGETPPTRTSSSGSSGSSSRASGRRTSRS